MVNLTGSTKWYLLSTPSTLPSPSFLTTTSLTTLPPILPTPSCAMREFPGPPSRILSGVPLTFSNSASTLAPSLLVKAPLILISSIISILPSPTHFHSPLILLISLAPMVRTFTLLTAATSLLTLLLIWSFTFMR